MSRRAAVSSATIEIPSIPHLVVDAPPVPEAPAFAKRLWTGGPGTTQQAIRLPDGRKVRPNIGGAYVLHSPDDYEFVKRALGPMAFEENLDEPEKCGHCDWVVYSSRAFGYHINNSHPGPRSSR